MQKSLSEAIVLSLQEATELYEQLLTAMEMEKSAAVAADIDLLISSLAAKERVVTRLRFTDQNSSRLIRQLVQTTDPDYHEPIGLDHVAGLMAPEQKGRLIQLGDALGRLVEKARLKTMESRLLISHCLTLVNNSLSFFNHWNRDESVYGASGALCSGKRGGGFVSSTV